MKPWVLRRSDLKLWYASDPSDLFRSRRLSAPLDISLLWGMQMRCDSFLDAAECPSLSGLSSTANTSSNPELSRGDPMRALHQRGLDKRQTPTPDEE
jgi:hypothetical protein